MKQPTFRSILSKHGWSRFRVSCGKDIALSVLLFALSVAVSNAAEGGGKVERYIDSRFQTALPFGTRSHWLQPWRAYLETAPAARLRNAVGINLNVEPDEADAVCRHLAKNGFCKVRLEFGWGSVDWENPKRLADPRRFAQIVSACKAQGLRPLFLLNAHHGVPCPTRFFSVRLVEPAAKGATSIRLDPAVLPQLVPGRSGLNGLTDYWAAEVLFTKIGPDGTAQLSKPLPKALAAGPHPAATLKYLPFYPVAKQGKNPQFEETLAGWLNYAEAVAGEAKGALGTETASDAGFDLEVWNELTFGSNFLSIDKYYEKPVAKGDRPHEEILRRTVAWVLDPKSRLPGVGVNDGFNNQWPWGAGSTAPPGLAALGKHPYAGVRRFPKDQGEPGGLRAVDALGNLDSIEVSPGHWRDRFVPTYVSHFPEYFLTGIQTEHLIRDLSPLTTELYRVEHGRNTHPNWPDGRPAPAPEMWITEVNLDPNGADPGDLAAYTRGGQPPVAPGLTAADADRMKAKAALRYLVAYANKGPVRFYFYAAKDPQPLGLGLVSNDLFKALKAGRGQYPSDDRPVTSPTMSAVRRLVANLPEGKIQTPRSVDLLEIAEDHGHKQFEGDPATVGQASDPHPPLYNRDCLAFFPFQCDDRRLTIAVYVMTRNLARLYQPGAGANDPTRFDMPPETYRLTIRGIDAGAALRLYDPLDDRDCQLKIVRREGQTVVVELPLTDSPRLIRVDW